MSSNIKERDAETWIKGEKDSVPAGAGPAHAGVPSVGPCSVAKCAPPLIFTPAALLEAAAQRPVCCSGS